MNAVPEPARERGAARMEAVTGENDTAARSLYESVGFTSEVEGKEKARALLYELHF